MRNNKFANNPFISEFRKLFLFLFFLSIIYACSSGAGLSNDFSDNVVPVIKMNVQAEYSIKDTVFRAKGEMIKQLSIVDLIGDDTRIFKKGVPDEDYTKEVNFYTKQGTWNIELIDTKGLMRDTSVSFVEYGEYTIRIPIILDNISSFEISEYLETLGEGQVIIDKIAN